MLNWLFSKTPLVFLIQPFWRDEAFSYVMSQNSISKILFATAKDFNPPLYYIVLHFWQNAFGSTEISLRSLSFIFYWATVYVGFLILSEIMKFKFKKSLFYTLLIAINPLLVYYAFEARMYSMLAFLSTLSFYSLYKKNAALYLLSSILGLYTHYFMIFVVLAQRLLERYRQKIVLLSFLPWLIFVLINRGVSVGSFWIEKIQSKNLITFIGQIYTGYEYSLRFYNKTIMPLSLLLLFIVLIGLMQKKTRQFKLFFVWGLAIPFIILIISFFKPIFLPRYLIFSAVGLILLIALIINRLPNVFKVVLLTLLIMTTIKYNQLQIKERNKSDIRKATAEIGFLMKNKDVVYVTSELDFFTVQYYLQKNKKDIYIWGKTYDEIPDFVGKALIDRDKVISSLPLYPNKAFILLPNGDYSIQSAF